MRAREWRKRAHWLVNFAYYNGDLDPGLTGCHVKWTLWALLVYSLPIALFENYSKKILMDKQKEFNHITYSEKCGPVKRFILVDYWQNLALLWCRIGEAEPESYRKKR